MYKVLFLGTPDFAVEPLKTLLSDHRFKVVGVVSQPDRPAGRKMKLTPSEVSVLAQERNLKLLRPHKVKESLEEIKSLGADVAVVVAFGQILPQSFLDLFPKGAVNIHGSLLPRWRGAAPIQRALMAGDAESGVSLQKVVKKLDAGAIIGERRLELNDSITSDILYEKLKLLGCELLKNEFVQYLDGELEPTEQDEAKVTVAAKIEKSEGQIDWSRSAREIFNSFRGLNIWPGLWTDFSGKRLKIRSMKVLNESGEGKPGKVLEIGDEGIDVQCGTGVVRILSVQPESKATMAASDFIKGYSVKVGDIINA